MPTKDVQFDTSGGPVGVDVRCGQAQDGAYVLTLWDGNEVVKRWEGNFLNPDDDHYTLPEPTSAHAGRVLQCKFEISIEPPIDEYDASMTLSQDGDELDTLREAGQAPSGSVKSVNLFARLKGSAG